MPKTPVTHDSMFTLKLPGELLERIEQDCIELGQTYPSGRPRVSAWLREAAAEKLQKKSKKRSRRG